jgi:hypothetical protein
MLGVTDKTMISGITALADQYAEGVIKSLPSVPREDLHVALSGTFLSFLAEALALAASSSS